VSAYADAEGKNYWTGNLSIHLGSDNAEAHLGSDIEDPGPSEPGPDGSVVEHLVYIQEVLGSIPSLVIFLCQQKPVGQTPVV
jgi:hypothetical protein